MTFEAFQRHLTTDHRSASTGRPFGQHAAGDYPSRLRRLEKLLGTSLEDAPPMVLRALAKDLRQDPRIIAEVSPKVMGDLARALREYADFLDGPEGEVAAESTDVRLSLSSNVIIADLRNFGFIAVPTGSAKIIELSLPELTVYVRLDARQPLIIHPVFQEFYTILVGLPGTLHGGRSLFFHNSSLSKFPRRDNGRGLIRYGIDLGFVSTSALRSFMKELQSSLTLASPTDPRKDVRDEIQEGETEARVMANARIGQGRFRADLLNFWQGHCPLLCSTRHRS